MIVRRPERQSDQAKAAGVGKSSTNPFNDAVLRGVQAANDRERFESGLDNCARWEGAIPPARWNQREPTG